jgi:hypothetical protein
MSYRLQFFDGVYIEIAGRELSLLKFLEGKDGKL